MRMSSRPRPSLGLDCRRRSLCRALPALAAAWAPLAARAAEVDEAETRAVRAVIEAQLKAFAADDAERAFSFASTGIRGQFGNAVHFMAMVRSAYPMLLRPLAASFFQPRRVEGVLLQVVQLRELAGPRWRATYRLERQSGAGWRISACVVHSDDGKSST